MAPICLLGRQFLASNPARIAPVVIIRPFSRNSLSLFPRKASQDRESINTESDEYTKSGTDVSSASQEEAAFDPKSTSPEEAKETAGKGNEGNPLEVSPANQKVSKGTEASTENSGKDAGGAQSGAGSPKKNGKP